MDAQAEDTPALSNSANILFNHAIICTFRGDSASQFFLPAISSFSAFDASRLKCLVHQSSTSLFAGLGSQCTMYEAYPHYFLSECTALPKWSYFLHCLTFCTQEVPLLVNKTAIILLEAIGSLKLPP